MLATRAHHAALVAGAAALLLLTGCATDGAEDDQADAGQAPAVTADATMAAGDEAAASEPADEPEGESAGESGGEHPEGLDASLPVPPGTLASATQEASAWAYVYSGVTSDEARAFAESLKEMGFEQKVTVDSDGVEQWYLQSADWAIKLEETHADESLYYWVDPIIE